MQTYEDLDRIAEGHVIMLTSFDRRVGTYRREGQSWKYLGGVNFGRGQDLAAPPSWIIPRYGTERMADVIDSYILDWRQIDVS
jgi:hypothetical protein